MSEILLGVSEVNKIAKRTAKSSRQILTISTTIRVFTLIAPLLSFSVHPPHLLRSPITSPPYTPDRPPLTVTVAVYNCSFSTHFHKHRMTHKLDRNTFDDPFPLLVKGPGSYITAPLEY
ncbi:hypothetical protein NPIL_506671 [Nephila pilipes]|uniref:Uncharacterized protein n=1 Tax=Nephila pilipes TaxID=299642 RepID=A0A8X6UEL6_NEPPI|nr:hypothetical protein NPIL_506671 [Nephila pilipes]